MKPTPCKNCKPMTTKTETVQDPSFDKLVAYLGGNPKDFSIKIRSVYRGSNHEISLIVDNLSDFDADPIIVQLTNL